MSYYDKKSLARKRRQNSLFAQTRKASEAPFLLWAIEEYKWSKEKKLRRFEISQDARWRRQYKKFVTIYWNGYHFILNNRNKEVFIFISEEDALSYLENNYV